MSSQPDGIWRYEGTMTSDTPKPASTELGAALAELIGATAQLIRALDVDKVNRSLPVLRAVRQVSRAVDKCRKALPS